MSSELRNFVKQPLGCPERAALTGPDLDCDLHSTAPTR